MRSMDTTTLLLAVCAAVLALLLIVLLGLHFAGVDLEIELIVKRGNHKGR